MCTTNVRETVFTRFRDDPDLREAVRRDPTAALRDAGVPDSAELQEVLAKIDWKRSYADLLRSTPTGVDEW